MDIDELWQKALSKTEIFKVRLRYLHTFDQTVLPYIYLGESVVNLGDVVVRTGKVLVEKPIIFLPGNFPQFEGFEIDNGNLHLGDGNVAAFLLLRGASLPTMKYSNEVSKLDVSPGPLLKAIERYKKELQRKEDVTTGLIVSPEDCWQLAVLLYVTALIAKSVPEDIKNILKRMDIKNN